ncbi:MAG TPA: adenosine kinase [Acidimicrobiia bacterium]
MGKLDVLAVGNALVDVLSLEADEFVIEHGLERGAMTLIDADRAETLYAAMGPGTEISGGSAANTAAGLASLGAAVGFVGRVRDDQLGAVFAHDIRAVGVEFATAPAPAGPPTGRCLIVVTPDAQRTLNTFLGAASDLGPADIDPEIVSASAVTFLEGYLFDQDDAKEAFRHAGRLAHDAGNRVALTLSDPFCVERHRDDFRDLVEHHIDVLFANEHEICSLYEVDDFDAAAKHVQGNCEIAALTRSEKGSVVVANGSAHTIRAAPVDHVVDTTGAGDQYAAGFLYGLTHGHDLPTCGRLGALAAAEVISHLGARPEISLADLARSELAGTGRAGATPPA